MSKIDTSNKFCVVVSTSGAVWIMNPPSSRGQGPITKADALVLAAYLVSLADPPGAWFKQVLEAVQNT